MGHILKNIINLFKRNDHTKSPRKTQYIDYSQNYSTDGELKDNFYTNLQKTIVWTEKIISQIKDTSQIDYSKVLRTTNPIYEGEPFYKFDDTLFSYPSTPEIGFDYEMVLRDALSVRHDSVLPQTPVDKLGRILKFEIDITTLDGAPCSASGFVDESDIPPIDTWFYITTKYLYCWIPAMFIEKMQDAIDVEILDSYQWLDEINPSLNRQILSRMQPGGS